MTGVPQKPDNPAQGSWLQPTYCPRKGSSLQQRDLRDGCVLHDQRTGLVCTLNSSASFILTFCSGDSPLSQIALETATAFGLRPEDAMRDVIATVQTLRKEGLLDPESSGDGHGRNGNEQDLL